MGQADVATAFYSSALYLTAFIHKAILLMLNFLVLSNRYSHQKLKEF